MISIKFSTLRSIMCVCGLAMCITAAQGPRPAYSQQYEYDVIQESRYKIFNFGFRDIYGQNYTLDFKIDDSDLAEARRDMPRLKDPRVQQHMQRAQSELQQDYISMLKEHLAGVMNEVNSQLPNGMAAQIAFSRHGYRVNLTDTGNNSNSHRQAIADQVMQTLDQHAAYIRRKFEGELGERRADKLQNILPQYLYDFEMREDGSALFMVDYSAVAARYRQAMRPLARALEDSMRTRNDRRILNATLNFFQSIPYDDFTGRNIANDSRIGFVLPSLMLELNRGDCDTKSVAMASTLMTMMPGNKSILILIPEHALLGVKMRPENGDAQIRYNGRDYVLMEPAGPGLSKVGMISAKSSRYINSGNYEVKEMFR